MLLMRHDFNLYLNCKSENFICIFDDFKIFIFALVFHFQSNGIVDLILAEYCGKVLKWRNIRKIRTFWKIRSWTIPFISILSHLFESISSFRSVMVSLQSGLPSCISLAISYSRCDGSYWLIREASRAVVLPTEAAAGWRPLIFTARDLVINWHGLAGELGPYLWPTKRTPSWAPRIYSWLFATCSSSCWFLW